MTAQAILFLYVGLSLIQFLWECLLVFLNMDYIRLRSGEVPEFAREMMDAETYARSTRYSLARYRFGLLVAVFNLALILAVVLSGLFGVLDRALSSLGLGLYAHGLLFIAIIVIATRLLSLPFALYSQFKLEARFGFNTMTGRLFVLDLLKGLLLSALIGIPLLLGLFWFMENAGPFWWLFAFGAYTVVNLLLAFIWPRLIAPLFNKFTPIPEGTLRDKIDGLLGKVNYKNRGIFVMDGSKRSKHSNAYFTGFGRTKRVVLYDTLVAQMTEEEIVAVLAHEIGHQKKRHVAKGMALSLLLSLAAFFVLSLLLGFTPLYQAFGMDMPSYHGLLVLIGLCSGPFTFMFMPLFSMLSRRHEYQADRFAAETVDSGDRHLAHALLKLHRDNLSNLTPHPLYSYYHYSHPTLAERLAALKACGKKGNA